MDYNTYSKRLMYLLEIINKGQCFSLKQIATKFDCSERTIKRMIAQLRKDGYVIDYCYSQKKFIRKIG